MTQQHELPPWFDEKKVREEQKAPGGCGCSWRALGPCLAVAFLVGVGIFAWMMARERLSDTGRLGPLVRVTTETSDRVYLLTGQWRTIVFTSGRNVSNTRIVTDLFTDLWAFDAKELKPLWRRRLETEEDGAMYGREILGAEGGLLWLMLQGRLAGISQETGDLIAEVEDIEAANPDVRGLLPTESRYYQFDHVGLSFTAGDARVWRLDSKTLKLRPAGGETDHATHTATPAAFETPAGTGLFQLRHVNVPGAWLGLLTDAEAKSFAEKQVIGGLSEFERYRLWKARATDVDTFFGATPHYDNFEPLPNSPEFVKAGLLSEFVRGETTRLLWLTNPDSVLVLHSDRLGEEGVLHLTRVAGPVGDVLWEAKLPLSYLQSVLPGDKWVVLYGGQFTPPLDDHPRDPMHTALQRLISIDLETGQQYLHDASDVDSHLKATDLTPALND